MHYYKILKHNAGFDEGTSYWEKLLARYLAATGGGKILTTLPITFTSTSWKLASWTIYGNNTPNNYSAEGTLPLTFTTKTAGAASDWSISGNDEVGKNLFEEAYTDITGTVKYKPLYVGNGEFTLSTTAGRTVTDTTVLFLLAGNVSSGASTNQNGVANDQSRTVTAVDGYVTIGYRGYTYISPVNEHTMLNAGSTVEPYEPYQVGVGQRTKNLFDFNDLEAGGYDQQTGQKISNDSIWRIANPIAVSASTIYNISNVNGNIRIFEYAENGDYIGTKLITTTVTTTATTAYVNFHAAIAYWNENTMFVEGNAAPTTFVPYGYEIPLNVNNTPQTFYIGDSPLTAGQSISKTSTGVDIAAIVGSNTITTDLYNKPEMSIEGVDYVGVGERTKNLYNPNATDVNNGYVNPGRLRADDTINTSSLSYDIWVTEYIPVNAESQYTLVDLIATSSFGLCYYKNDKTYISGETYSGVSNHGNKTVTTPADCKYIRFTTAENYDTMLVEGSTAPQTYIPCGYEVPITVSQDGQTDKNYNVYIGDSPLTEGQSISNTQEIEVFEGENTIDTTLYNKPVMEITYE